MSTAVAKKQNTEVSTSLDDAFFEMAGAGSSFAPEEMTMPFIRIAQQMSPQLNKNKPEYIKGLGAGDIYNNLTGEFWDGSEGLEVVACAELTKYTEWVPMERGGGFVGELHPNDPAIRNARREGNKEVLPSGNELIKADHFYVLYKSASGTWNPAVLDMKITALKVSRRWKSQINLQEMVHPRTGEVQRAPIFYNIWKITTVEETNRSDQSYSNYAVSLLGRVSDTMLFQKAVGLYLSVQKGEIKATAPEDRVSSSSSAGNDDIPF